MKNYLCNPPLVLKRLSSKDYNNQRKITSKWLPISSKVPNELYGNICMDIKFNPKTLKAKILKSRKLVDLPSFWECISSSLLMYRLACIFQDLDFELNGPNGYKVVWNTSLRHVETGEILSFGEWKGGVSIWSKFHGIGEAPESYQKDLLELLTFLVSNKVVHPYDGVVAGSVA